MNSVGDVPYPSCGVLFLTPLQPEPAPTVDIIDFVEAPQTPTTNNINVADVYDWQHHANIAEQELSIERTKLQREKRKTHRFQAQINEYIEALACSTEDCRQARSQCQFLSNTNWVLSHEVGKLRLVVQTLEGVIHLLYTVDNSGSTSTSPNKGTAAS
jgi:hypothetical protein